MRLPGTPGTVRGRLLGLLLLATLPVLGLAAVGLEAFWRAAMQDAEERLALERDHAVALNRARVATADALLGSLAVAVPLDPARCAELLAPAEAAGLHPLIVGPDGAATCGSGAPPAALFAAAGNPRTVRASENGAAVLLARPLGDGSGFATAEVPLQAPATGATLWLLEASGSARPIGAGPDAPPPAPPRDEGAARVTGPDGTAWLAAAGSIAPGLDLLVARPEAPIRRAALFMLLRHLGEIAAILALGGAAVFIGAGHAVTRPLARLRAAVARWRAGAPLEIEGRENLPEELRDLAEAFRDGAAALADRDAALSAAVDRAEVLAEEVHHRVKNNLQIVSSLLALQAGRVSDPAARIEFEATRDRVAALATLHRHMYVHHDPEAIDLSAFLQELGEQLFAAVGERPGRRIRLTVEASPLRIASDQAVPLTLLITEAVSVALKHGFPGARRGHVAIRLAATSARAQLTVEDDGTWPRAEDRLRASLMRGFARQLGGELQVEEGRLALDLPLRSPLPREKARLRGQPAGLAG